MAEACPLCNNPDTVLIEAQFKERRFLHCKRCYLIYTASIFLPENEEEKQRYLQHHNDIGDPGYVRFLHKIIDPVMGHLKQEMVGLDYGCGPDPVLSKILNSYGFLCDLYDPFFFPEISKNRYEFIFATECFEHFFNPNKELDIIDSLLTEGGILAIMTDTWEDIHSFGEWHYIRDITHIRFYHKNTILYICNHYKYELMFTDSKRSFVLRKLINTTPF